MREEQKNSSFFAEMRYFRYLYQSYEKVGKRIIFSIIFV